MSGDPFRERRLSPAEARRVIQRAAQLGDLDPRAADGATTITERELARRLVELGLPDDAVRRAMTTPSVSAPPSPDGAVRVVHEERIDGTVPRERHEAIADAISDAMGQRGRIEVVGSKLTWTPGGLLAEPAITVHSKEDRTSVRVEETLANRGQLVVGSVTLAVFAAMFGTVPGIAASAALKAAGASSGLSVAVVMAFVLACAVGALVAFRKLFRRRIESRTRFLDGARDRVVTAVRGAVVEAAPRRRIEPSAAETSDDAAEREIEAEAEAEAEADRSDVSLRS